MAITFSEKGASGNISAGGQNDYAINALARATEGETSTDVFNAARANTSLFPLTVGLIMPAGTPVIFIRETLHTEPKEEEGQAATWFVVSFSYVPMGQSVEPYATGDSTTTFAIGTQSINVKTSKATSHKYSTLGTPPDLQGCINVTDDGVQGVDLDFPTYTWTETHIIDDSAMTSAYKAALYAVCNNPVSSISFKGFAAGEPKILGVEGSQRHKGGDWEINFKFAASPNFTSLTVGTITSITKKGWEYLWCRFEESTATVGSGVVRTSKVRDVYVEQVYGTSDFSTLGIGT